MGRAAHDDTSEYTQFRDDLGQSSGFQSYQYRAIEYLVGNRNLAMLRPHAHRPEIVAALEEILAKPSLYDEALRLLARRGFALGREVERDWRQMRVESDVVQAAWREVYRDPQTHWDAISWPKSSSTSRTISAAGASIT